MATTFGRCSESGASGYGAAHHRLYLGTFDLGEDGNVSQITIYGKAATGSIHMKACIYDDDGEPNNLKGVSSATTVNTTLQWWTFTFDPAISLTAGTYWLGWNHDGGGSAYDFTYYYVTATGEGRYLNCDYDDWPNPIGNMNTTNKSFCVCATYTPSGGATYTKDFTADSILKATLTKDFTTDSILKATFTKTADADAILTKVFTKAFTSDAILTAAQAKTFDVDAILTAALTKTFSADAILSVAGEYIKSFTADAILKLTDTITFDVDAILQKTSTQTFDVDAYLTYVKTKSFTADARLKASLTKSFTVDAIVGWVVTEGGVMKGPPVPMPPVPMEFMVMFKQYLEAKLEMN